MLYEPSKVYKPFKYPWCLDFWERSEKLHWGPWEAELQEDVKQWKSGVITPQEKNHITQILRLFTQSDVNVAGNYCDQFIPFFRNNEVRLMLLSFAARETIHQVAYALLNDTLGMDESEYSVFLTNPDMKAKMEFMSYGDTEGCYPNEADRWRARKVTIARQLAKAVCNEGMSLFSAFAMLMNYQRFGKMKGMCEIVRWSVVDETCFSDDTEILTPKGWKLFKDLGDQDQVAQYDPATGDVSFVEPLRRVNKPYNGPMVRLHADKAPIDLLVTPDHDILFQEYSQQAKPFLKVQAKDFKPHYRRKIPLCGTLPTGSRQLTPHERFLVALQADGSLTDQELRNGKISGCYAVTFQFLKAHKIEALREILAECGYDYTETPDPERANGQTSFYVKVPVDQLLTKDFTEWQVDLSTLSLSWCEQFLDEISVWDAQVLRSGNVVYCTTNRANAEFVQTIGHLCGVRANLTKQEDNRKESYKDYYRVFLRWGAPMQATGMVTKNYVPYSGRVYCVTVPAGAVMIRRNGRIMIAGNCHLQGMTRLFQEFCKEHPEVVTNELKRYIYDMYREAVDLEDKIIDIAFEMGPIEGLTSEEMKQYIRYIADRRLVGLGLKPNWSVEANPLPWLDHIMSGDTHTNFFEARVTDYSAGSLTGDWGWGD